MKNLSLLILMLVAVFFAGCSHKNHTNPNYFDEQTGQCTPNGESEKVIDNDNDGLVDCAVLPDGRSVFFAGNTQEATEKRLQYLHHLIDSRYITWQSLTPEELKDKITWCSGEQYVAPEGCKGTEIMPYPGGFATWTTRDSQVGLLYQKGFDRTKPTNRHQPKQLKSR